MITHVAASGWKCGDFSLDIGEVNVLAGPNGSGKTAVLDAVRLAVFGSVESLGKQNQSLMRGARGRKLSVEVSVDGDQRSVVLERKGASVKKTASHDPVESQVPLSVSELMGLTGDQFRSLLSLGGDKFSADQYLKDISAEVPIHARAATARCPIHGEGGLSEVGEWLKEIQEQVKREKSNLKQAQAALANTQQILAGSQPVPAGIVEEWEKGLLNIRQEISSIEEEIASSAANAERAANSKRNLQAAKELHADLQGRRKNLESFLDSLRKAKPSFTPEDVETKKEELRSLVASIQKNENRKAALHNFVHDAAGKFEAMAQSDLVAKEDQSKAWDAHRWLTEMQGRLPAISVSSDECHAKKNADELQEEVSEMSNSLSEFRKMLRSAGLDSIEHGEDRLKAMRMEEAASSKTVEQLEGELIHYEGKLSDSLEPRLADLRQEHSALAKKISDAREYRDLTNNEAGLQESAEKLEGDLEDLKLVEKAAVSVQAKYLDRPLAGLTADLDKFAEAAGLDFRIRPSFEKIGKSTTLVINLERGKQLIPIEAVSGGEQILVGCAFLFAIHKAKPQPCPVIFVEAAELDSNNASRLHSGLQLAATCGIQGFMTTFDVSFPEAIVVGEAEAVA